MDHDEPFTAIHETAHISKYHIRSGIYNIIYAHRHRLTNSFDGLLQDTNGVDYDWLPPFLGKSIMEGHRSCPYAASFAKLRLMHSRHRWENCKNIMRYVVSFSFVKLMTDVAFQDESDLFVV